MSESNERDDAQESGRIEAFSDGVYAFAITRPVLELEAPHDMIGG